MPRLKGTKSRKKIIDEAKAFDKVIADLKQDNYRFHLDLCGQIFEGTGATALDALKAIPVPQKVTTKGQLIITHGKNKKVLQLLIPKVKRLFYPNFQEIIIKQLVHGL